MEKKIKRCCTFFGHRDCPENITGRIEKALTELICENGVEVFLLGNQGNFDYYSYKALKKLKTEFPQITYKIVLAYIPNKKQEYQIYDYNDSIYPDGLEKTPPRFAISKRNEWMLQQSDYVITYIRKPWGCCVKFVEKAKREKKNVINLADENFVL